MRRWGQSTSPEATDAAISRARSRRSRSTPSGSFGRVADGAGRASASIPVPVELTNGRPEIPRAPRHR